MKPELSFIMPTYNDGPLLIDAIKSILSQEGEVPAYEIIVINDGGTDPESGEIFNSIGALDKRIRTIILDRNSGVPVARNTGFSHSTGEWVIFFDADDLIVKDALASVWTQLRANPDAQWVGADYARYQDGKVIEPDGEIRSRDQFSTRLLRKAYRERCMTCFEKPVEATLRGGLALPGTCFLRRELFSSIGRFDEKLRYAEDFDLFQRLAISHDYYFIPEIFLHYRQWEKPDRGRMFPEGYFTAVALEKRLKEPAFANYLPLIRSEIRKELCFDMYRARHRGDIIGSWRAAGRLLQRRPFDLAAWKTFPAALIGR